MELLALTITNSPKGFGIAQRWCTHLGDGLLVERLSTRVRTELLTHLATLILPDGRVTAAWVDHTAPQGWSTRTWGAGGAATATIDGLQLHQKITKTQQPPECA